MFNKNAYKITNIELWKKILFAIVGIIVLLRVGYILFRGEINKEYVTSNEYDLSSYTYQESNNFSQTFHSDYSRLYALEFLFDNISDDKQGTMTLNITKDSEIIYQTNMRLEYITNWQWYKVYVNIPIEQDKTYRMTLTTSDDCTQIPYLFITSAEAAPEIESSYVNDTAIEGQAAIKYGYMKTPSIIDRLVTISIWLIILCLVYYLIYKSGTIKIYYTNILNKLLEHIRIDVFVAIIQVILCSVIIENSGIDFEGTTKIILYVVSLFSALAYDNKMSYMSNIVDGSGKKISLYIICLYAGFALVGQRFFIYPLNKTPLFSEIITYIMAVIWFIPIVHSIIYYLNIISENIFSCRKKLSNIKFIVVVVLILLIPALYGLYAFNPGITSEDTLQTMVVNAQNLHGMNDWYPFFYCWVTKVLLSIWNTTYMIIFAQYLFYALVYTELFLLLREKNVSDIVIIMLALLKGVNITNILLVNTIWKDIPYTLSLVWALVILAKFVLYEKKAIRWYVYAEFAIAMVGIALYRKNGFVTFVIIALFMLPLMIRNKKVIISFVASILLIAFIQGPLYSYYEVENTGTRGMYIGLGQDILGAYYNDGEVSESTIKMVTDMTEFNNADYYYNPTWANQSYDVDIKPVNFIINYIDTFIKNPILVTRAVADREDALWGIFQGEESSYPSISADTMDNNDNNPYNTWNNYYPRRQFVSLYFNFEKEMEYVRDSQWVSALIVRSGLMLLLGIVALQFIALKGKLKRFIVMASPAIGHILSLLLSTGWSPYRYFWAINKVSFVFILIIIIGARETTKTI